MARFGLDYETLSQDRADLVMLSTCMRGQTGFQRSYSGFGNQGAALAGLFALTGWPDRPPTGPWGAYTDFIAPRYGVSALAAAILHRKRTGHGQHVDLSQIEAGIQFTGPLMSDYSLNGVVAGAPGDRRGSAFPQGTYACAEDERYVAIEVVDDGQWQALCDLLKLSGCDANWSIDARRAHAEEVDKAMRKSISRIKSDRLEAELIAADIPAHLVAWPTDLRRDAQLEHRGFFVPLEHPEMGLMHYDGFATHFSATPPRLDRPGPLLGQHSEEVAGWFGHHAEGAQA
jgi:benzylsuccinate CoA-transferase BbsF subunit